MYLAEDILYKQQQFFKSGASRDIGFRKAALQKLLAAIYLHSGEISAALNADLGKSQSEALMMEISSVTNEIKFMLKNISRLARAKRVKTDFSNFKSVSKIYNEPYGCVLIMSPWNYPFNLSLSPLAGAIAAGNCAVIKPSNYSSHTSAVIKKLVSECFDEEYIAVLEGGREVNSALLDLKFDYIFFTGGKAVGRLVMSAAAKHLTPVTLELGGKSPCIVDETADISLAAKRICWGKLVNAGQTCVAPDYIFVHKAVKAEFIKALKSTIEAFYTKNPINCEYYPKIINQKHFDRLSALAKSGDVIYGGESDAATLKLAPVILDNVTPESEIMQDEIFGPIIPLLEYERISETIDYITSHEKPLACYIFSASNENISRLLSEISFGGGCVNDTIMHLSSSHLPFGGVGESGMGGYHGKYSFYTFTHRKSVLKKSRFIDIPLRYPPFTKKKQAALEKILK